MSEKVTEIEIRILTELWIDTYASDLEKSHPRLRSNIEETVRMVLRGELPLNRTDPTHHRWLALRPMLRALRGDS